MQILGLHFDSPCLRLAILESKRNKKEIRTLKSLAATEDVKEIYIASWEGEIAMGIGAMVRTLEFKLSSKKQIEQGLAFQVESLTHLPLEEITYVANIQPNKEGAEATIFFTPKQNLTEHLEEWKKFSLEPDFVTANAQALSAFINFRCPELQSSFLIDLGSHQWTCAWMEEGKIKKTFVIPHGVESLFSALWEDRKKVLFQKEVDGVAKQIDLLQLKPLLNPHLSERLETLRCDLANVLLSFQQVTGPRPLFFTGRVDAFGRLREYLAGVSPELSLYEPAIPLTLDEYHCAIAIGLALEFGEKKTTPIQFLKEEFVPRKAWRRAGQRALGLITASLLLSTSIAWIGLGQIQEKKEEMVDSFKKLIDAKSLRSVFLSGIDQGIEQTVALIDKYDKESPYLLQSPTVSEFLSWLSHHPIINSFTEEGDPLEIIDIQYQLDTLPKMGAMRDPYSAKVTVEFKVANPMNARKFHESLLESNDMIDHKQEVNWESLSSSYRTSFTLKNRTPYVP